MKPTVAFLNSLPAKDTRTEALWRVRLSRASRYAATPAVSQAKRRKLIRRQKGGAK